MALPSHHPVRFALIASTGLLLAALTGCASAASVDAGPTSNPNGPPSTAPIAPPVATSAATSTSPAATTTVAPTSSAPTTTRATAKATVKPSPTSTSPRPAVATPTSSPTWVACTQSLGGVQVQVGAKQRSALVVNGNGGSFATVSFWVRTDAACGFVNKFTDSAGRIGANGMTDGATRTQGTNTTPTGTYTMTEAFGIAANPGTALPYRKVGVGDWWVEDNNSTYYNDYRNQRDGEFDWNLPASDPNSSERLLDYGTQYRYAIVVNFNRAPDVRKPYRGAGIFVHVRGSGATAGCIAVSSSEMVTMLNFVRPSDTITIVR